MQAITAYALKLRLCGGIDKCILLLLLLLLLLSSTNAAWYWSHLSVYL